MASEWRLFSLFYHIGHIGVLSFLLSTTDTYVSYVKNLLCPMW